MTSSVFKVGAASLFVAIFAPPICADEVRHISTGTSWKYFRGLAEASAPDPGAWRQLGFDDSAWATGTAPLGYGIPSPGTDLSLLSPPMQGSYTAVYLRRKFEVADPGSITRLEINVDFNDGFILWLNGAEALRINVPGQPGDPVPRTGTAAGRHPAGEFEGFAINDPAGFLAAGTNVAAVMVFNDVIGSPDLKLDLELLDPFGPDRTPPAVAALSPEAGATVRSLSAIEVRFTEGVVGVNAADLLVNGLPASALTGSGAGPYLFTVPALAPGPVEARWAANHAITDLALPSNSFAGGSWSYTLNPAGAAGEVVINEFLASNRRALLDEDGEASDWIEILNRGPGAVNLLGYALTDDAGEPDRWTFPQVTLDAGRYLVVFASGKDRKTPGGKLHTNFQLAAGGEYLALREPGSPGRVLSEFAPVFPGQRPDHSYGPDSTAILSYFPAPSPGASNGNGLAFAGFAQDPRASRPRGHYQAPFTVELTSNTPGATIRYTLDGSEPAAEAGTLYTGPIPVAGSPGRAVVTLRAAAFRDDLLPSNPVSWTYLFPEEVLVQPAFPAGFPTAWGTAPAVDYGMDPQIVNDPAYHDRVREGLLSLPVVSLVLDRNQLFGAAAGIYSHPEGQGLAWERPGSVELIYPDGRKGFQVNCGVRIQGGASRLPVKSPKHSFRLHFRGDYGPTRLEFPLFADSPVDRFDVLVLRAGFNNSWIHWASDQRSRADYVRDQWAKDTQLAMGQPSAHGLFVNLYLNGLYWGLFNLVERPEASFASSYFGGEEEDYDALNAENTLDGDRVAWDTLQAIANGGVASPAAYQAIQKYLDVPNLIDYLIVNIYGANQDWPSHNWYVVRRREPGAGYRFFSWDAERTLEDLNWNSTGVADVGTPAKLYSQLRANPEFRLLFADHLHRHLFGSGALTPGAASERFTRRAGEIDLALVSESARWGDYRRDVHQYSSGPYELYTRDLHFQRERNRLLNQYFPQRSSVVLAQFRSAGLYPAVGAPVFNLDGGEVSPGVELTMSLPVGTTGVIYSTTDGSDPRVPGAGTVSGSAEEYSTPLTISDYLRVRARVLQGAVWSALNEAVFTVSAPLSALKLTEIMYHPPEDGDQEFLELKNTGSVTLDLGGLWFSEGIDFVFPAGTTLAPGKWLVLAENPDAFAARYPGVPVAGSFAGSRLSNGGERLTIRDASGNEVLSVGYRDDGAWPLSPDGFGWSLVPADPAPDPEDPRSWRASAAPNGSPGGDDPAPVHGGVAVSEVLVRAQAPLESAVELQNLSGREVDVSGWFLSDSRVDAESLKRYPLPPGTRIPAGGFRVFYQYQFDAAPGGPASFELSPYGGGVYLASADAGGNLTGHLVGADFGGAEDGVSFGRYQTSNGVDFPALESRTFGSDAPANLAEFRSGSGKPNAPPRIADLVLNEVHYHPPEGGDEFIEIHNRTDAQISLYLPGSGRGFRIEGIRNAEATDDFEFGEGAVIGGRGYLLVVGIDPAVFRSRYAIPPAVPVVGPFGGALDNSGERLKLLRPDGTLDPVSYLLEDQVRFGHRAPWPAAPNGTGASLERVLASRYGNDPLNWGASLASGGTPGAVNSRSAPSGNQPPVAAFSAVPRSGPAPLTVDFDASLSYDPDGPIARYDWLFGDGASGTGRLPSHTFALPGRYTVSLEVVDGEGARTTATALVVAEDPAGSGLQLPADGNQDGRVDLSDAIALLGHLFFAGFGPLPCQGDLSGGGNETLLDASGDAAVDVSDAVHLLVYLFQSGPPPALGTSCVRISGCPDACR